MSESPKHTSRDDCVSDELFTDNFTDVDASLSGVTAEATCPLCGRMYEYSYNFVGVWDKELEEYVETEVNSVQWDWDKTVRIDRNFVVPTSDDKELELVFDLNVLLDDGEVLCQF